MYIADLYYDAGETLYLILLDDAGLVWSGSGFTAFSGVNSTYSITAAEDANRTQYYSATVTGTIPQGDYTEEYWSQAGTGPVRAADYPVGYIEKPWKGNRAFRELDIPYGISIDDLKYTYTSVDQTGSSVTGAAVWVTSDVSGDNVIASESSSLTAGKADFYLDAGTVYFWGAKAGVVFSNPSTVVVTGPVLTASTYTVEVGSTESRNLYVLIFDEEGLAWNGSSFTTFDGVNANFDVALTEDSTRTAYYAATITNPKAGIYYEEIWDRSGGSPDRSLDTFIGMIAHKWMGSYNHSLARARDSRIDGKTAFEYTLKYSDDTPIPDAQVIVTSDTAGTDVLAEYRTDQAGKIAFQLATGTYQIWAKKSGINTQLMPDQEVVS